MKRSKGITLVALVISIIILLMLTGIVMHFTIGEKGLIPKAIISTEENMKYQALEELRMKVMEIQTDNVNEIRLQNVVNALNEDKENNYIISLEPITDFNKNNKVTDIADSKEIYVIYKKYQFKIDNKLVVTLLNDKNEEEIDKKHIENNEWITDVPQDDWLAKDEYYNTNWEGQGTEERPYLIKNEKDLAGLSYKVANGETFDSTVNFKLTKNLNMDKHIWVPIGGKDFGEKEGNYYEYKYGNIFKGNFDGDNHTIKGIYYNNQNQGYGDYVGVFGYIEYTTYDRSYGIKNLGIADSYISGCTHVGGIVGWNKTIIDNCFNTSSINGKDRVGGIVGGGYSAYIYNSYNAGTITCKTKGIASVGGLVGYHSVACYSSYNIGKINVEVDGDAYVGGIRGETLNNTQTHNSYNVGEINVKSNSDKTRVGGICGKQKEMGYTYNCYNIGNVNSNQGKVGGLVGEFLVSNNNPGKLEYCYFQKNEDINNSLSSIGMVTKGTKASIKMIGYFKSIKDINFTYTDETIEETGYEGVLLFKLNKWLDKNNNRYPYWKMDEELGYPINN